MNVVTRVTRSHRALFFFFFESHHISRTCIHSSSVKPTQADFPTQSALGFLPTPQDHRSNTNKAETDRDRIVEDEGKERTKAVGSWERLMTELLFVLK